jgi:hypothetical protein
MRAISRHLSRARVGMQAYLSRALALAAVVAIGLFLVAAVPGAVGEAWDEAGIAASTHESLGAARIRIYGESYTRAIDEIRRALPADEGYLLVEGGSGLLGGTYWVRYDLAPRRAVFLGRLDELTSADRLRRRLSANLRHVVVAFAAGKPPRLYDRYRFLQEIDRRGRAGSSASRGPGSAR